MTALPSSNSAPSRPRKSAPSCFRSTQSSRRSRPPGAPAPSLEATEPFPDRLFRVPVPNRLFAEMPGLSDSALRALLALIRLAFRFAPDGRRGQWVCPQRSFRRAAVQRACGLSAQGTREGLSALEDAGYVEVDRSGKSHEYVLTVAVPERRYTYLPTPLLDRAPSLPGTGLRLVLTVLRATWGWTAASGEGASAPEHRRWACLSTEALARRTGRSETAVREALQALEGRLLRRRRPGGGAYHYRFRTETLTEETHADAADARGEAGAARGRAEGGCSTAIANDLTPDRQQTDPPHINRENKPREAQQRARAGESDPPDSTAPPEGEDAVRADSPSPESPAPRSDRSARSRPAPGDPDESGTPDENAPQSENESPDDVDLTGFSPEQRSLGQTLANIGVWPRRIPELLGRYSAERIRANVELYRRRAPSVRDGGAWLAAAIEGGYALPSPGDTPSEAPRAPSPGRSAGATLPAPGTKVSERRRRALIREGLAEAEDFDRFRCADDPDRPQHFYRVDKTPSPAAR